MKPRTFLWWYIIVLLTLLALWMDEYLGLVLQFTPDDWRFVIRGK